MYRGLNPGNLATTELTGTNRTIFRTKRMALEMIRLATSQTPMGQTPGHCQGRSDGRRARPEGSTKVVQSRLASNAKAWETLPPSR